MNLHPEAKNLVSTSFININFYANHHIIEYEIRGFIPTARFQEEHERVLEMIAKHRPAKVIANFENAQIVSPENQEYISKVFYPKMIKNGVRYQAVVNPKTAFGELMKENISKKLEKDQQLTEIEHYVTDTRQAALEWLLSIR